MSFCSLLIKGITPKICMLCVALINSLLLNLLCVWIINDHSFQPLTYLDLRTTRSIPPSPQHARDEHESLTSVSSASIAGLYWRQLTRFQARSKDQEISEEGGGAGPSN